MKLRRGKHMVDPPTSASSDIAFILIIFFFALLRKLVRLRQIMLNFLCLLTRLSLISFRHA